MNYQVTEKQTGKVLNDTEILTEVNRDRSAAWAMYTLNDLKTEPKEPLSWIDTEYYTVEFKGE